jgi:2-oxoglutarate ferredoxin oxidoreductase subunit delta
MALKSFGREPLDRQQVRVPRGQVFLIPERCKGCGICIEFCPVDALIESARANRKGYHLPEVAQNKEEACIHCQFCSLVCPEFAIYSTEVVY